QSKGPLLAARRVPGQGKRDARVKVSAWLWRSLAVHSSRLRERGTGERDWWYPRLALHKLVFVGKELALGVEQGPKISETCLVLFRREIHSQLALLHGAIAAFLFL